MLTRNETIGPPLRFSSAWSAALEFALRALVDVPMRAGVAEIAVPEDK